MDYIHIQCIHCGGIIELFPDGTFGCRECGKDFPLRGSDYDKLMVNDKTGWIFPMLDKSKILRGDKND